MSEDFGRSWRSIRANLHKTARGLGGGDDNVAPDEEPDDPYEDDRPMQPGDRDD